MCNGTRRVPAGDSPHKRMIYGYDIQTDTFGCTNCGGQTMSLNPTGRVPLRPDGTPCHHEYVSTNAGRCYTIYTCKHCSHSYDIDSGD